MPDSINLWVARLCVEPLPVMRRTLTRVKDILAKPSANHSSLCEAIEFDPGFSLHVLRKLKSLPNQPKEPVSKLANAISLLGMTQVEQVALDLPVLEDRLKGPPRRGLLECYSRAAHAAVYANALNHRLKFGVGESLASSALLHDIGEMALWNAEPEVVRKIHRLMQAGDTREDAALQILGFPLEELNQQLGERWQLPELTRISQGQHNSYQAQPLTVMLACAVARDSAQSWNAFETLDHLELLAEFLEISLDQAQAQLHQTAALAARRLHGLPLPLPAFRLVHAADNIPKRTKQSDDAKTAAIAQASKPRQREQDEQSNSSNKKSPGPSGNPIQEKLRLVVDEMRGLHGLDTVMLAMLTSDRTKLLARFVSTRDKNAKLHNFVAEMQQPNLFSALLKKPQSLWLNPKNLQKYRQAIPESILPLICPKGCLLMSVFINNKSVGLFYADGGASTPLSEEQYHNFKLLCQRFTQELSDTSPGSILPSDQKNSLRNSHPQN